MSLTAAQIINGLVTKVPTAKLSIVYTAATDVNHQLGRPNGYTSKASFTDKRIKASDAQDDTNGSVDLGGGVEVYPKNSQAVARGNYIQGIEKHVGFLGHEYDYTAGGVLLRLSPNLTPSQASAYAAALTRVTGASAKAVSPS